MDGAAPCRFFQSPQGCFRGASCSFRHDPLPGADAGGESSTDGPGASVGASTGNPYVNSARPCRFFTSGMGCRNGSSCPFAHIPAAPAVGNAYGSSMEDPLSSEFGGPAGAMAVNSGGAVYYNHPGMPPPMMMVMPDQASMQAEDANGGDTPTSDGADTSAPAPRRRLKIQANPQKKNHEVISEIMPVFTRDIEGPFFAIDVECVATGTGTNDRDVARIAVVDEEENVVFDQYVKPEKKIVSYLTQLTGITESDLVNASNLNEALVKLRSILPKESVIVGQSIKKDLEWLTLEKAADYRQMFDVADLFRLPMQSTNGTIRYRYFSLRHVAKYLLGHNIQEADHDPVIDAKYAMKVFKQFRYLHESPGHRDAVYQTLLKTPRTPSFAERYPVIDGVSMRAPRKPGTSPSIRNAQGSRHSIGDGASQNQYGSYTQQYHKSSLLL